MIDILLIFPPYSLEERYGSKKVGNVGGFLPPLGLAYLASYLRDNDISVDLIDTAPLEMDDEGIIGEIKKKSPAVIGISTLTPTYHCAVKTAERIRKEFPEKLIVIGGHHATVEPVETLTGTSDFDLVVHGEGEYTLLELMQKYKSYGCQRDRFLNDEVLLKSIKGIAFRSNGEVAVNEKRGFVPDINSLPDPAWDLLPMDRYIPLPNQYLRQPVVHMLTTRGCPFSCSYCSCNAVFGRKIRSYSPERVINKIKHVMDKYGAKEISFWDDTITVNKKWIKEVCQRIIDEKLDITWTCLSRVDTIDREMVHLMKKAGCWNVFFGFETDNQKLLDIINKRITADRSRQVVSWMKEAGIEIRASFMIALPGETPQMALDTIKFAIELDADYAQFCITTPYPGTKLYEDAAKYGTLHNNYSKYSLWQPVFVPHGYKDLDEISRMEKYAMRRFYFRPGYILKKLRKIRSLEDLKRHIKGLKMAIGMTR